ncbi:2-octaprenyl-6-methoxyphenyl hydroxylase [Oceanisphaera sp.]|uniref:2-octaprenyl-6-methoxyphenyl hydroxylase n=1 Tax=Oceanisphaera sp. TaxID=1929979 RepID=UPI003A8E2D06
MTHYDVVINGGGLAGAVLALGLSQLERADGSTLRIALIERSAPDQNRHPGFDARSIALAGHSCELLQQLGLWSLLRDLATPITAIQVSDQGHFGQVNMQAQDYSVPALGNVIELAPVGQLLYQQLQQHPAIELFCPAQIATWQQAADQVMVTLDNDQRLTTSLLVAADGHHSRISRQLKLPRRQFDYQQSAIIANVQTAMPHQGRAFERFTPEGPIALLPMSGERCSLVWCVSNARAKQLMACDDSAFLTRLQQEFGYRLGRITRTGTRHCYPLVLDEVTRPWHHRVVLVGNAAHLLHPIAGQGFNLGLRDVAALVEQVRQALLDPSEAEHPVDLGSHQLLSRYGQSRQADQAALVGITSALALLFSNDHPVLAAGRNLGLMTMAACSSLKHSLAWQAMGKR